MRRRLLLAAPALALTARPVRSAAQPGPLATVVSFTILADLVRQVGGDLVAVTSLVAPDGDVHTFQPRPSDLGRIKSAAILVENGLGLEPWLTRMVQGAGFKGQLVIAANGLPTRSFAEDGRTVTDPHVWQDPHLAIRMVAAIAAGLAAAAPAAAAAIKARATTFTAQIAQADADIDRAMAAIPPAKRQVITSHDAFGYYGARYGITFRAAQGINTEAEPTPRDLARLAAQIRHDHIRAVFVENMTDPRIAEALAREAGAVVGGKVYSDSLSPADGSAPTYIDMLRYNTKLFTAAMAQQ